MRSKVRAPDIILNLGLCCIFLDCFQMGRGFSNFSLRLLLILSEQMSHSDLGQFGSRVEIVFVFVVNLSFLGS